MVLSDNEIRKLAENKNLLSPFFEDKLQAVSYDISSGDTVMIYQSLNVIIDLRDSDNIKQVIRKVDITNGYHIKPNEYILVKTAEKFSIPSNLTAHIRPRTTFTKLWLIAYAQHMNPNFNGYLYIGVRNVTPNIIDIYPGLKIAQMIFEQVVGDISEKKLYNNKVDAKYQNEDEFISPAYDKLSDSDKMEVKEIINKVLGCDNV